MDYQPFHVSFTDQHGKRRRWVRWSPEIEFIRDAVSREMIERKLEARNRIVTFRRARGARRPS